MRKKRHNSMWGTMLQTAGKWVVEKGHWVSTRRPWVYGIRYSGDWVILDCQREGDGIWISVRAPRGGPDGLPFTKSQWNLVQKNTEQWRERKNEAARNRRAQKRMLQERELRQHEDEWRKEDLEIRRRIWRMKPWSEWGQWIYLDLETTGLSSSDSVLSCAIIDDEGNAFYDLFRPRKIGNGWREAQAINGISPLRVRNKEVFRDWLQKSDIGKLFAGRNVVIYNSFFDMGFFPREILAPAAGYWCAMRAAACAYGDWSEYHQNFRWQKLWNVWRGLRDYFPGEGEMMGPEHSALADVYAARDVWHALTNHLWGRVMRGKDIEWTLGDFENIKPASDSEYAGVVFDPDCPRSQRFRTVVTPDGSPNDYDKIPF